MGLKLFCDQDPLEAIKEAILQHEDTFRHQVLELHRLYWTQRKLMGNFSSKDPGDFSDPSSWRPMPASEKSSIWSSNLFPPDCSASYFANLYRDGQGNFSFPLPPDRNGYHRVNGHPQKHDLTYKEGMVDATLELTLGGSNRGKYNVIGGVLCGEYYLHRPEVIDLDDSIETMGNEEGMVVTSFGPKTPTIFSEARRDYKQPRLYAGHVSEKAKKYLDCDQFADPTTRGRNTINGTDGGNQFSAEQSSPQKVALFDLNTSQPEELDIHSCELDNVSSTEIDPSICIYKPRNELHAYFGNASNESSSRNSRNTSVLIAHGTLNSSLINSLVETDPKVSEGLMSAPDNLIVSSQQSSNESSSFLPFHPVSLKKDGVLPSEGHLACDNGATCSGIHIQGRDVQSLLYLESRISREKWEETAIACSIDINHELQSNMSNLNDDPASLCWSSPVEKPRTTKLGNSCPVGFEGASEQPDVIKNEDPPDVLPINSHLTGMAAHSVKPNLIDCSHNFKRGRSFGDNEPFNDNEFSVRWPEELDRMVLMASTSLVHMSLVNTTFSSFGYADTTACEAGNGELIKQPESSIDSLERMVLSLPENQEECSSPFVPMGESTQNSKSKYSSRSGRQLRDFQKDILPGIVALSRHEICEDLHAFTEIVRSDEFSRKGVNVIFRKNRYTAGRSRRPRRR